MTASLHPLANVFAVRTDDPDEHEAIRARMTASGAFSEISQLHGWLIGTAPLPGRRPDPEWAKGGVFVAEGADHLGPAAASAALNHSDVAALAHVARTSPGQLRARPGDFGFLAVDPLGATIVRSCAGLVPWLVEHRPERTVISTRSIWYVRMLPQSPMPDLLFHAAFTDGMTDPDRRTPWLGVRAVQGGYAWRIEPDHQPVEHRYWDPNDLTPARAPLRSQARERAPMLRETLIAELDRDLARDGVNLIGLSGGLDSSSLAALAVRRCGRRLHAFTLSAAGSPNEAANRGFVAAISAVVQPEHHWWFRYGAEDFTAVRARTPRLAMPIAHPALIELAGMHRERPITVYTGGELADDQLAGPYLFWHDWLHSLSVRQTIRALAVRDPHVPRALLARRALGVRRRRGRHAFLPVARRLSPVFDPALRAEYEQWSAEFQARILADTAPYWQLNATREMDGWMLQNWEVCSELGIRRSLPFVTRATFEWTYATHPSEHALPPKRLLRLALADDTPAHILTRRDKGAGNEPDPLAWNRPTPAYLEGVLRADLLANPPATLPADDADTIDVLIAALDPANRI